MMVDCPTCEYEFETATGLECPRCGESIGCSTIDCTECDACSSPLSRLGTKLTSRISFSPDGDESSQTNA